MALAVIWLFRIAMILMLVHVGMLAITIEDSRENGAFNLSPKAIRAAFNISWFSTIIIFALLLVINLYSYICAIIYFIFKRDWPSWFK